MLLQLYLRVMCVDPIDGIKGKTWGPSTMHKDRFRPSASVLGNDRCCKSAPNIQKTFCHLGGHSNIGALQELGKFSVGIYWYHIFCFQEPCKLVNDTVQMLETFCTQLLSRVAVERT